MIRFGFVAFVQLVATCPCKRRVSTRANTNLILPSPMTVPSGIAPFETGAADSAFSSFLSSG